MALDFATYQSSPSVGPSVRTVGLDRSPDCSPVQSVHEPRTGLDRHVIGLDWTGLRSVGPVQSSRSSPRLRTLDDIEVLGRIVDRNGSYRPARTVLDKISAFSQPTNLGEVRTF